MNNFVDSSTDRMGTETLFRILLDKTVHSWPVFVFRKEKSNVGSFDSDEITDSDVIENSQEIALASSGYASSDASREQNYDLSEHFNKLNLKLELHWDRRKKDYFLSQQRYPLEDKGRQLVVPCTRVKKLCGSVVDGR